MGGGKFVLDGKPIDHYIAINDVLDAHDINDAKELNDKLGAVRHPRLNVVDDANRSRLLGSLPRPEFAPQGAWLQMYAHEHLRFRDERRMETVTETKIETLSFRIVEWRKGWDIEMVLATSALLSDLLKIPEFRLPGETAPQAKRRWEQQTFG